MTGADRQWRLNRENFTGCWQGTSHWYLRGEPGEATRVDPTQPGRLDLERPARVIADTRYAIQFSDADTGVWDGSGLLFAPGGRRRLPLSRETYNRGGSCWQFRGAGGQSSLRVDSREPRFGHEINLFHGRSRSMLVLLWDRAGLEPEAPAPWRLGAVGAVAFRCADSEPPEPPRPPCSAAELLTAVEGWPGRAEILSPGDWPEHDPQPRPCAPFRAAGFAGPGVTAALADRLVFSVPEVLPHGAFRLEAGCLLAADRFHQLSLSFDQEQQLSTLELRRFSPAGG